MTEQIKRVGTLTIKPTVRLEYVLSRVEKIIRMLLGQVRYIDLAESDEIILLPYMWAHEASKQDMNLVYVEELDKVFIMSNAPRVMFLVSEDQTVEILRDYSEPALGVRFKKGGALA